MFEDFERKLNDRLEKAINESLETLKKSIDEKTPEDTKTLLGNNDIEKAKQSWNEIKGRVYNETKYWIYVEYGVKNRDYNYHKPKGQIFYTWFWARMFTRWFDETKQEIITNIKKAYE